MNADDAKDFIDRLLVASTAGDSSIIKELMAPNFVAHIGGGLKNRDEFIQHMSVFKTAFSDLQVKVEGIVFDGKKLAAKTTWLGTHDGIFMGLPPTGKRIEIEAYMIERIEGDKTAEHWSLFDQLTMMHQLGMVPQPRAGE